MHDINMNGDAMKCPQCGALDSKVIDSRPNEEDSSIRRRRECLDCGYRFTTYERLSETALMVIKADGSTEAFDRDKLLRGVLIACAKRPISAEVISDVVASIENELQVNGRAKVPSHELGNLVLSRLRSIDDVAYVRFASVYRDFKSIDEFKSFLENLDSDQQ